MSKRTLYNVVFSLPALSNLIYLKYFYFISREQCEALVTQLFNKSVSSYYEENSVIHLIILKYAEELLDQCNKLHNNLEAFPAKNMKV